MAGQRALRQDRLAAEAGSDGLVHPRKSIQVELMVKNARDYKDREGGVGPLARCGTFRCVTHSGTVWGSGISEKVVWWVVRQCARKAAIDKVAPHDLRRTCARLCHSAGGELEQIQFLLGHRSVETTERYLGSRQRIVHAVNDKLDIEPDAGTGDL